MKILVLLCRNILGQNNYSDAKEAFLLQLQKENILHMKLGVNIDHIASIREIRKGLEPEPIFAVFLCETSGADSIVVHLREDRRHINERDLRLIREGVRTKLNLEMSIAPDIVDIACEVRPDQVTLVPERRQELTTEGGLDAAGNAKKIKPAIKKLQKHNIDVSLFIDPVNAQIDAGFKLGVRMIELHTGRYADARTASARRMRLDELKKAVGYAQQKKMIVNAGHGLDYYNVGAVASIRQIEELNIGYSIICRAALVGLERAVREMKVLIG
ncbi:MAG: pyridoxine 5'-phosphate synthase [Candidatus Omnitrophota bacterium]